MLREQLLNSSMCKSPAQDATPSRGRNPTPKTLTQPPGLDPNALIMVTPTDGSTQYKSLDKDDALHTVEKSHHWKNTALKSTFVLGKDQEDLLLNALIMQIENDATYPDCSREESQGFDGGLR